VSGALLVCVCLVCVYVLHACMLKSFMCGKDVEERSEWEYVHQHFTFLRTEIQSMQSKMQTMTMDSPICWLEL